MRSASAATSRHARGHGPFRSPARAYLVVAALLSLAMPLEVAAFDGARASLAPTWLANLTQARAEGHGDEAGVHSFATPRNHLALAAKRALLVTAGHKAAGIAALLAVPAALAHPIVRMAPVSARIRRARPVRVLYGAWRLEGG